jgi:MoaA/NifB/PqqE/SkfB family radical SAM enzyme
MKGIRHHSPEYVMKHIKYLQDNFNAVFFNISDELTISNSSWADGFCRVKKEMKLDFLFRINSARVDLIDERILRELKDAGMVAITFGIESGSQKMLDNMHKHTTVQQNITVLNLCRKIGLQTTVALVVGLPGENFHTVLETARFLAACPHYPNVQEYEYDDMSDLRIFTPVAFPDTLLYKQGLKLGIICDEHSYLWTLNDNNIMRSYNFSGYPNFFLKFWIHILYFVYKMCYFWEHKKFWDILRLIRRLIAQLFLPARILKFFLHKNYPRPVLNNGNCNIKGD